MLVSVVGQQQTTGNAFKNINKKEKKQTKRKNQKEHTVWPDWPHQSSAFDGTMVRMSDMRAASPNAIRALLFYFILFYL